jgi:hypothetical protein
MRRFDPQACDGNRDITRVRECAVVIPQDNISGPVSFRLRSKQADNGGLLRRGYPPSWGSLLPLLLGRDVQAKVAGTQIV